MERLPAVKLGALDLDSWPDDFGGEFTSPLSLLSPNAWHRVGLSPARSKPANGAALATAALGAAPPPPPLPEEENKALAVLPQFGARGGKGHAASRRPDARRQSLAIGAMFAGLSSGAGLLGDSELAVGDEDIQVPLAKSGKLLGGATNHSTLFCEPDTHDLLDTELPSPDIPEAPDAASPPGSAAAAAADGGTSSTQAALCDSPQLGPMLRDAASTRKMPDMRASTAVFGDLRKACEGQGLDDFDGDDFQLQESSRVKELAFLFKMEGTVAMPRSSVEAADRVRSRWADAAPASLCSSGGGDSALADIQQRLQQYNTGDEFGSDAVHVQAGADKRQQAEEQEAKQPQQATAAQGPAPVPAAAQHPAQQQQQEQPTPVLGQTASSGVVAKPSGKAGAPTGAAAGAAKAAASRLPPPPARISRLRPPTTASGYFSNAATSGRQPARPDSHAAPSAAHPAPAAASKAAASGSHRAASAPSHTRAAKPAHRPAAASSSLAAEPQALSRLAQSSYSRIPTPSKPAVEEGGRLLRSGMFEQQTLYAAAARQRPAATGAVPATRGEAAGTAAASSRQPTGTPAGSARVPALRLESTPSTSGKGTPGGSIATANLTPNTARLRWLEQNPEVAFGGGTKLAASPAVGAGAGPAKKLTAEERHLMEWQDHL